MLTVRMTTRSGRPLRSTLNKFAQKVVRAGGKELVREGHEILAMALPLTPLDRGPLRASGRVEGPTTRGSTTKVIVAFGNQSGVDYALIRHWKKARQYTTEGTGINYLTIPLDAAKPGMSKRIRAGINRQIRGSGFSVT